MDELNNGTLATSTRPNKSYCLACFDLQLKTVQNLFDVMRIDEIWYHDFVIIGKPEYLAELGKQIQRC